MASLARSTTSSTRSARSVCRRRRSRRVVPDRAGCHVSILCPCARRLSIGAVRNTAGCATVRPSSGVISSASMRARSAASRGRVAPGFGRRRCKSRGEGHCGFGVRHRFGCGVGYPPERCFGRCLSRRLAGGELGPVAARWNGHMHRSAAFRERDVGHAEILRDVADGFGPDQVVQLRAGEGDEVGGVAMAVSGGSSRSSSTRRSRLGRMS